MDSDTSVPHTICHIILTHCGTCERGENYSYDTVGQTAHHSKLSVQTGLPKALNVSLRQNVLHLVNCHYPHVRSGPFAPLYNKDTYYKSEIHPHTSVKVAYGPQGLLPRSMSRGTSPMLSQGRATAIQNQSKNGARGGHKASCGRYQHHLRFFIHSYRQPSIPQCNTKPESRNEANSLNSPVCA